MSSKKSFSVLVTTGLFPPEIGGPATYSKFLADALPRHGIAVHVLPFRDVRKYPVGIRHIVFFFQVLSRGRNKDVLYAQDTLSVGLPTMLANIFLRKKFLVRVPGDHVWEQGVRRFGITGSLEEMPLFSWEWHPMLMLMRIVQQWVVASALALVVPSRYMARVVKKWSVNPEKVHLIYNGVEEMKEIGNRPVLRGLLNFRGKLVISIGRLVPWKGFHNLLTIVPNLKKKFPDMRLLIIGGGPDLPSLEKKAEELGIGADVIFAGEVERDVLIRYIRASDVFVLNSRYEGLSHQILEVMAVGVPVIATNVGGNPEIIEHEKTGYLVQPDTLSEIEKRIEALLTDQPLRARIAAAAKRAARSFSNERMVSETATLIQKLCPVPPP